MVPVTVSIPGTLVFNRTIEDGTSFSMTNRSNIVSVAFKQINITSSETVVARALILYSYVIVSICSLLLVFF